MFTSSRNWFRPEEEEEGEAAAEAEAAEKRASEKEPCRLLIMGKSRDSSILLKIMAEMVAS